MKSLSLLNHKLHMQMIILIVYYRLTDPSEVHVAVGSNYLDTPRAVYQVKKYIQHPDYNSLLNINDIGLIRVAKSIKFNDDTSAIALPTVDSNYDNYLLKVTGWGRLWVNKNK